MVEGFFTQKPAEAAGMPGRLNISFVDDVSGMDLDPGSEVGRDVTIDDLGFVYKVISYGCAPCPDDPWDDCIFTYIYR